MNGSDLLRRGGLYARTLAHLHPVQVAFRPVHIARTALLGRSRTLAAIVAGSGRVALGPPILALQGKLPRGLVGLDSELARAAEALAGKVTLVGRGIPIKPPSTDFALRDEARLVRYQMAYLGAARSLAVAARVEGADERAAPLAVAHLRELIERVPPGEGDAWDPYPVAMRLLNMVVARELLLPVSADVDVEFLKSALPAAMAQHARWLGATLELHLLGNHLFTDGVALFVAGCVLDASGDVVWRAVGKRIIERSLAEDILPDGGHSERSPMYAAIYLDQLELVLAAALSRRVAAPEGTLAGATALAKQLQGIAHPDGDIPLFGDSALGEAAVPADLGGPLGLSGDSLRRRLYGSLAPAEPVQLRELRSFPQTGVHVIRSGEEMLAVDAGPLGAADQPGHAHSDALTFELSHRGRRFVTDGGAGHYDSDALRAYFRGPLAHSSVSVDGRGSDEVWSAFRAGKRARISPMDYAEVDGLHVLRGTVSSAWGWRHERLFFYAPGRLLCVVDRASDVDVGANVESHLHLAPDVEVSLKHGELRQCGATIRLVRLVGEGWRLHRDEREPWRGLTAMRLGETEPSPEVAIGAAADGEARVAAYALVFAPDCDATTIEGGAHIKVGTQSLNVRVNAPGLRWEVVRT